MVNLWISASLLGLTGWQGYRLGREYGWWGRAKVSAPGNNKNENVVASAPSTATEEVGVGGLGHSKTDFNRLLTGFTPETDLVAGTEQSVNTEVETDGELESVDDEPIAEPTTTLMAMAGTEVVDEYPDETDQVPDTCNWMDDEDEPLEEEGGAAHEDEQVEERVVSLDDYIKRVKTVQRKMNQLAQKRQLDSGFMKQELGVLIQTYQLDNDQSLDWLFQQHGEADDTDYGSVFDRIERLAA